MMRHTCLLGGLALVLGLVSGCGASAEAGAGSDETASVAPAHAGTTEPVQPSPGQPLGPSPASAPAPAPATAPLPSSAPLVPVTNGLACCYPTPVRGPIPSLTTAPTSPGGGQDSCESLIGPAAFPTTLGDAGPKCPAGYSLYVLPSSSLE